MTALSGSDMLFSRKGEAQPAVQAAIGPRQPNRFEALARNLGVESGPGSGSGHEPGPSKAVPAALRLVQKKTPGRTGNTAPGDPARIEAGTGDRTERPAAARGTRAPEAAGSCPPWIAFAHRRGHAVASARGTSAATAGDRPDLDPDSEAIHDRLGAAPATPASDRPGGALDDCRRRRVSVRLPPREHELLRQFSALCGATLQDIVRRAILTYMITDLNHRLETRASSRPPARS